MTTIFSKILKGEIPGNFVYRDDLCSAFLDVNPINPGHTLLVPVAEVDSLWALDEATYAHLWSVAKTKLAPAIKKAIGCPRVGVAVEGFAVPHAHIHLVPLWAGNELDPHRAKKATSEELSAMKAKIVAAME